VAKVIVSSIFKKQIRNFEFVIEKEFTAARLSGTFTPVPFYVFSEWKKHHQNF